jgi:hypothetical protein
MKSSVTNLELESKVSFDTEFKADSSFETEEQKNFKSSGGIVYSPKGHIYQISYATKASQNSDGILIIKTQKGYLFIKSPSFQKTESTTAFLKPDVEESFKRDCWYSYQNGVFCYFLGHQHHKQEIVLSLKNSLWARNELIKAKYPGYFNYTIERIVSINSQYLAKNRVIGITTVLLTEDHCNRYSSAVIRPNNKIFLSPIILEGNFDNDSAHQILKTLSKENMFTDKIENFEMVDCSACLKNPSEVLKNTKVLQKLKGYLLFELDFSKTEIRKLTPD